jgi:hypothetical protein
MNMSGHFWMNGVGKKSYPFLELLVAMVIIATLTGFPCQQAAICSQGANVRKIACKIITVLIFANKRAIIQYGAYFDNGLKSAAFKEVMPTGSTT